MHPPNPVDREKERAALVSLVVKIALTAGKFAAAAVSGSLALVSEAGNNLGDVAMTMLSLYSIRIASKPADADHQFGHGKVEAVSALVQTGFLFALALVILIEAVKRLAYGGPSVEPGSFAFGVLVVSILVDLARWVSLDRIAKATKSPALAADALNFATDIVASALALGGLIAARLGFASGDTIAALGVSAFIGVAGYRLARDTIGTLIDTAPRGMTEPIRRIIAGVPGVIVVDTVRLRLVGPEIMGDAVVGVPRTLSIEQVDAIKKNVASALGEAYPDAGLAITARPMALDDETIVERVVLIATRLRIPVHHVTVQRLAGGATSVSFDAELDGRMSIGAAHDDVTRLEIAIKNELGAAFEVESHIEPLALNELDGRDGDGLTKKAISEAFDRKSPMVPKLRDIHDVRVRTTPAGLIVNYHCLVAGSMTVDEVHLEVDELERLVRQECQSIVRIVGHAEPAHAPDAH